MTMKTETVDTFLAELQAELDDVLRRKSELESLIAKCKSIFGASSVKPELDIDLGAALAPSHSYIPQPMIRTARTRPRREKKIWQQVNDLLEEVKVDLSLRDIEKGFQERSWPLEGKNSTKILYRAMRDKPDIFVNTNRGTWDLKKRTS
jgi:hypothetical protein